MTDAPKPETVDQMLEAGIEELIARAEGQGAFEVALFRRRRAEFLGVAFDLTTADWSADSDGRWNTDTVSEWAWRADLSLPWQAVPEPVATAGPGDTVQAVRVVREDLPPDVLSRDPERSRLSIYFTVSGPDGDRPIPEPMRLVGTLGLPIDLNTLAYREGLAGEVGGDLSRWNRAIEAREELNSRKAALRGLEAVLTVDDLDEALGAAAAYGYWAARAELAAYVEPKVAKGVSSIESQAKASALGADKRRIPERETLAKEIWAKHPTWKTNRVATEISGKIGGDVGSISRSIKKHRPEPENSANNPGGAS